MRNPQRDASIASPDARAKPFAHIVSDVKIRLPFYWDDWRASRKYGLRWYLAIESVRVITTTAKNLSAREQCCRYGTTKMQLKTTLN